MTASLRNVVDVSFRLNGRTVPAEHALVLRDALLAVLPWLAEDEMAGVHQIHVAASINGWQRPRNDGVAPLVLSRRTPLVIRLDERRVEAARALEGHELDLNGHRVQVGGMRVRALAASPTLYARQVLGRAGEAEPDFMSRVDAALRMLAGKVGTVIGGLAADTSSDDGPLPGRSLMVTGLDRAGSVRLQTEGLGPGRLLGCGIFLPHKGVGQLPAQDFDD